MYGLSKSDETAGGGAGDNALAKGISPVAPSRLASAADLMGTGDQLAIPRLEGVPVEYLCSAGDSALIASAESIEVGKHRMATSFTGHQVRDLATFLNERFP